MIQFCKRCLYGSSHPLGIIIDAEGICSGCRIHEEKDSLDWELRALELKRLVAPYKSTQGNYDCIVPVTGANDSYFTVWYVKEQLQLNPLLVNYNTCWNTPIGIHNLANLRISSNCDLIQMNVNPVSVKKITKTTLRQFGNMNWHALAGHTVHPVQTSIRKKIPLIIWGAHQGVEQVGMFSYQHEVEMTRHYRKMHDLFGYEADDLINTSNFLTESDLYRYRYPTDSELFTTGTRGIYLNNYIRWDPSEQHRFMVNTWNYRPGRISRTFDSFDHSDSAVYMFVHDWLKLLKHGYSKITDQASREIRFGRISRPQAKLLVEGREQLPPENLDLFSDWLGTNQDSLRWAMDLHRNPNFWSGSPWTGFQFNGWSKMNTPARDLGGHGEVNTNFQELFPGGDNLFLNDKREYVVIGKGFTPEKGSTNK